MPDVVSKSQPHQYVESVSIVGYPIEQWDHLPLGRSLTDPINPALSHLVGIPPKHWKRTAENTFVEMDQTEKDLIDAEATGWTVGSGQTVAQWLAEHGGDTTQTNRRIADEQIDLVSGDEVDYRAIVLSLLDEIKVLRSWLRDFQTETAAATSLADFQARVGGLSALADRTKAQAKTAIAGKITSGNADT